MSRALVILVTVTSEERLERYAELAVRVGANVQPGQSVFVTAHVLQREMAHAVARRAWIAGAAYVDVRFRDDRIRRQLVEHGPDEALTHTPPWLKKYFECQDGQATIWLGGDPDPGAFAGADGERVGRLRMLEAMEVQTAQLRRRAVNWTGLAYPSEGWAQEVYGEPDVERLWDAVAYCTYLDSDDVVGAWRAHMMRLEARAQALNRLALNALRYRGPGVDFTIGLSPKARWTSALYRTSSGIQYVPNLPTEEVFTTPDATRAEGTIRSSRPMKLNGRAVAGLELTVEGGRIIAAHAEVGEDVVAAILDTDDGARRFGEVALVDGASRVGQLGTLFHDMLYDENACAHIAFGAGIPNTFEGDPGGALNESAVHVDFMVGRPELEVDGLRVDGSAVPLLRDERWQLGA